jgi:hypothetical protein
MMNKTTYLTHKVVTQFTDYIARLLDEEPFHHKFIVRDRRIPPGYSDRFLRDGLLTINSLEGAFDRYWWAGKDFLQNKEELDKVASIVKKAIRIEHQGGNAATENCLNAIREVLEWGAGGTGVPLYTANYRWAMGLGSELVGRVQAGRNEMTSDTPSIGIFSCDGGPRMNAGFTKYYSLACGKNVVIYDGRVGAALGLLVLRFVSSVDPPMLQVPPELDFRWGSQNPGSRDAALALNRNPSRGVYVFRKLPSEGGAKWARVNIMANWVLGAAIAKSKAKWCRGSDGLRKVEAALFTIGYEMPPAGSQAPPKTKKLLRNARRGQNNNLTKVAHLLGPKATAFSYAGTFQDGFRIEFGDGILLNVPYKLLKAMRDTFTKQIVTLGASRSNGPHGSIGDWLSRHSRNLGVSLSSQNASRLTAVLTAEGIVEVVPHDRRGRGIRVRFISDG